MRSFDSNQHLMLGSQPNFHSNFSESEYDAPNFDDYYDKLQPGSEYPDVATTDYEPLSGEFDYTHPNYANQVYERTMQVANEIMMESEYAEASLNPGGAPRDATQVEVNVRASGEQGGNDQTHDPKYV